LPTGCDPVHRLKRRSSAISVTEPLDIKLKTITIRTLLTCQSGESPRRIALSGRFWGIVTGGIARLARDGAGGGWQNAIQAPGRLRSGTSVNAETCNLSNTIAAAIPTPDRQAVTRLLSAWQSGDAHALELLTPLIYEELRNRARRYMKRERPGHTLQATAVVHEAFVKLVEMNVSWQDRAHFFAVAARQMRRILVDHAKTRFRTKRGGTTTGSLEELDELNLGPSTAGEIDVLEIDEALYRLAGKNPRLAELVELHYFGGLTYQELSETLKVSEATVDRDIRLAKAWMLRQIRPQRSPEPETL
jgi:RNA polymerase sigma factor (TIGR02999 family)